MAIVIFTQNVGAATWIVVANAVFNNSLRKQLSNHISSIGLDPDIIIESGARSVRKLGLSPSQLAAVLKAYATSIDHVMYLGIAVAGSILLWAWGMGFDNILEIKKRKELTNNSNEKEAETGSEEHSADKGGV